MNATIMMPLASFSAIEQDRREMRREACQTLEQASWSTIVKTVARIRTDARRRFAMEWVAYCVSTHGDARRPAWTDDAWKRPIVLKLAALGIIDPEGFDYGLEHGAPRARRVKGNGDESAFRDMHGDWVAPF